eukprot:scaffold8416_cov79-Skeletonema_marinoi.AAC.1
MPQLKLGSEMDIRHSAAMFEQVVQNYLRKQNVLQCFMTEADQRRESRRKGGRLPPSPDFWVRDGYCVQLLDFDLTSNQRENTQEHQLDRSDERAGC